VKTQPPSLTPRSSAAAAQSCEGPWIREPRKPFIHRNASWRVWVERTGLRKSRDMLLCYPKTISVGLRAGKVRLSPRACKQRWFAVPQPTTQDRPTQPGRLPFAPLPREIDSGACATIRMQARVFLRSSAQSGLCIGCRYGASTAGDAGSVWGYGQSPSTAAANAMASVGEQIYTRTLLVPPAQLNCG